jgi:hypothetical protein
MTRQELSEYFDEVAGANASDALKDPGDKRLAINAIMTLDGFFGSLHVELFKARIVRDASDDKWKETLAQGCQNYRVLRDTAYALKHGNLTGAKPRLVRRPDNVFTMPEAFDRAAFDRGAFDTGAVWIDATDTDYKTTDVIKCVADLAREWLGRIPS